MLYDMFIISVSLCVLSRATSGACQSRGSLFVAGSDFDGLCFVGQVCHGELNGSVLSTTYTRLWLYVV